MMAFVGRKPSQDTERKKGRMPKLKSDEFDGLPLVEMQDEGEEDDLDDDDLEDGDDPDDDDDLEDGDDPDDDLDDDEDEP